MLELLCGTPKLEQRHSHSWVIVKIGMLWREDNRKFLFLHFVSCQLLHFTFCNAIAKPSNFSEESKFHFNVMDNYGFCAVLCNTDLGSEFLVLGNTLGILLKNITLLFSL